MPHFGAGFFREALMLADLCPNVYLDTSSSNSWMRYEGLDLKTVFRRALDVAGAHAAAVRHGFVVLPARLEFRGLRRANAGAARTWGSARPTPG